MADPVDEAAERLYGLPLDEFTSARNEAAKELRERGLRAEADEVKALPKPSAAAWAVNQLTRRRHADLDEFLEAAAAARDAQLGGGPDAREAVKALRGALDRLVRAAHEELGGKTSQAVVTRNPQSLQAAGGDAQAAEAMRGGPAPRRPRACGVPPPGAPGEPPGQARPQRPPPSP